MSISEIIQLLTAVAACGAVAISYLNRKNIHEVHLMMNDRLSQLLERTRAAAHGDGVETERKRRELADTTPK